MSGFTALRCFKADKPEAVTLDALRHHAFQSIDEMKSEAQSVGWTSIDDMLDTTWASSVPEKGEWICFALRVDKRKIPGAVQKKAYAEALKQELELMQEQGKPYVSRSRKAEIKDQVHHSLMGKTTPMPAMVPVALQQQTGLVLVGSTSKMVELVEEYFQTSFGVTLTMYEAGNDVQQVLQGIYADGVEIVSDDHVYSLAEGGQVVFTSSGGTVSISASETACSDHAPAGLQGDIGKLKIRMERSDDPALCWMFTLTQALEIPWLKLPVAAGEKGTDTDDDAAMLERLYLLEQLFQVINKLFDLQVNR